MGPWVLSFPYQGLHLLCEEWKTCEEEKHKPKIAKYNKCHCLSDANVELVVVNLMSCLGFALFSCLKLYRSKNVTAVVFTIKCHSCPAEGSKATQLFP